MPSLELDWGILLVICIATAAKSFINFIRIVPVIKSLELDWGILLVIIYIATATREVSLTL